MKIRSFLLPAILMMASSLTLSAQGELPDLNLRPATPLDSAATAAERARRDSLELDRIYRSVMGRPAPRLGEASQAAAAANSNFAPVDMHGWTPGQATIHGWSSGAVVASGGRAEMPGLMAIESGAVNFVQSFGRFTLSVGGEANKYAGFNFLHTQYGLNATLIYSLSERISLTAFGSLYFDKQPSMRGGEMLYGNPAAAGYYRPTMVGGYADFVVSEHWGVQVGAQAERQMHTGRLRAEPIVTPYYRFNKNFSIGLPVGQMLYHIIDNARSNHSIAAPQPGAAPAMSFPGSGGQRNPGAPRFSNGR